MQWHLHYHPLPLSGDVEQRARENGEPNEMDNLCLAFVRWPCSAGVRVFVCFNYKSLFIVAELRQEQAAATRRHRKRVRCNILYCFLGTARFAGVYGFFALPFAITTIVVSKIFFFIAQVQPAQIRFHFIRLLDALSPVANTFFSSPFFCLVFYSYLTFV